MKLTSQNIIIISTTLPNNKISENRRNNLISNFSKYSIPILFNHGVKEWDIKQAMFKIMKEKFEVFMKTTYDYAILCDDDFFL